MACRDKTPVVHGDRGIGQREPEPRIVVDVMHSLEEGVARRRGGAHPPNHGLIASKQAAVEGERAGDTSVVPDRTRTACGAMMAHRLYISGTRRGAGDSLNDVPQDSS